MLVDTFIESQRGGTPLSQTNARAESAAPPTELILFLSVCTQGFISGFALIAPWAMQEYRAYGTHNAPEFWCESLGKHLSEYAYLNL